MNSKELICWAQTNDATNSIGAGLVQTIVSAAAAAGEAYRNWNEGHLASGRAAYERQLEAGGKASGMPIVTQITDSIIKEAPLAHLGAGATTIGVPKFFPPANMTPVAATVPRATCVLA